MHCACLKRFITPLLALFFVSVVLGLSCLLMTPDALSLHSQENGTIEDLSFLLEAAAAVIAGFVAWRDKSKAWGLYAFFVALAALREIDAHSMFTTMSILKSKFYVSPDVPLNEKLGGASVILLTAFAAYKAVRYHLLPTLRQAWQGVVHAQAIYTAFAFIVIAKTLDSFSRLFPFLHQWHMDHRPYMGFAEENLEMTAGLLFMLAPLLFALSRKR